MSNRRVQVRRLEDDAVLSEAFDHLVIATGAAPIRPELPGSDARGIYGLAILEDGIRVRQAVEQDRPARAVIVGGGFIGLEMAEALVMRGLEVSLVERASAVMNTLDPDIGDLVSQALRDVGVTLYLQESVEAFKTRDGRVTGVRTDQRTLSADLVTLGIGTRPNVALAREAAIAVGQTGAIKVNARMQTHVEGVWAAGDCAETFHLVSQQPVHVALGTIANKQGRICGINLGGGYATFPGVVGTAVSKICACNFWAIPGPGRARVLSVDMA